MFPQYLDFHIHLVRDHRRLKSADLLSIRCINFQSPACINLHPLLTIPALTQVWLVVEPIDMRAGIDGLSQRIQNSLGRSPCDGSAYAFHNHRCTRIKLLVWDGTGVWLCQRRLHQGHFTWPTANTPVCTLTATQWQWLITGVDWRRLDAAAPAHWRV